MLYPNDATEYGKELRLKQQFFFVSASLQVCALHACSHVHFAPPALQKCASWSHSPLHHGCN